MMSDSRFPSRPGQRTEDRLKEFLDFGPESEDASQMTFRKLQELLRKVSELKTRVDRLAADPLKED